MWSCLILEFVEDSVSLVSLSLARRSLRWVRRLVRLRCSKMLISELCDQKNARLVAALIYLSRKGDKNYQLFKKIGANRWFFLHKKYIK